MVRIRAFQARGPGSIPGRRIYFFGKIYILNAFMAEWSKAVDSSSILFGGVGSNPTPSMLFFFALTHLILNDYIIAPLAQTVER